MTPFGFLVIDKPQGMTSHDVVAGIRRGARLKRVGHAGTLDPMATGVLVVCIGAATRLSEYVMRSPKVYRATVRLGIETETDDAEGRVTAVRPTDHLTRAAVEAALMRFQGEQEQVPPMYSALKQGGRRLYALARRGETLERKPRRVWLETRLVGLSLPDVEIVVTCSAGTYIRSLARDLGAALGVGGHLAALRRLRSGMLSDPVAWETFSAAMDDGSWTRYLIDERRALPDLPELSLDAGQVAHVLHGRAVEHPAPPAAGEPLARAYAPDGQFVAILKGQGARWQPVKVFHPEAGG